MTNNSNDANSFLEDNSYLLSTARDSYLILLNEAIKLQDEAKIELYKSKLIEIHTLENNSN